MSAIWRSGGEYGRGHGEVDCGLLSHCGSPGHSVASHCGPPGRGMASLVVPSNGIDPITVSSIHFKFIVSLSLGDGI